MRELEVGNLSQIGTETRGKVREIRVWNRRYTCSDTPFLSSVCVGGEEILAGPMRLVGLENGREFRFLPGES